MNREKPIRNILFLQAADGDGGVFSVRRQSGALRVAMAKGWFLHTVALADMTDGGYWNWRRRSMLSASQLASLWRLDGAIVECVGEKPAVGHVELGRIPIVFMDPKSIPRGKGSGCVFRDEASFAEKAAQTLFASCGGDFAFVPWMRGARWCDARGAAFAKIVRRAGRRIHQFPESVGMFQENDFAERQFAERLAPWLRALPKPVGIFAANDHAAKAVALACASIGVTVPDDVSVIGVDDLWHVCGSVVPALSSIPYDFEGEGAAAAELLSAMMDEPDRVFPPRKCQAGRVSNRGSTRVETARFHDGRIGRGMAFIREKACDGIGQNDVAKAMFTSLTVAKALFRQEVGHTILFEIHSARLEKAKTLLAGGVGTDVVAQECGYSSANDFRRVFKRRVGKTVRQWLKANL